MNDDAHLLDDDFCEMLAGMRGQTLTDVVKGDQFLTLYFGDNVVMLARDAVPAYIKQTLSPS